MAESFPEDIIDDILLRLPAKSLMRFKRVCKRWRSLISDPGFVKSHLRRLMAGDSIPSQRIIIGSNYSHLSTIDCEALDGSGGRAVVPHGIKTLSKPCIVGSCDGLVCFLDSRFFRVYNPTTREYREFLCSNLAEGGGFINYNVIFHGFGYDSRSDDYKIVEGIAADELWVLHIFSLKFGSWRTVLVEVEGERHLLRCLSRNDGKGGVYWNGALHWYVRGWINPNLRDAIVSFDLSEEKFHRELSVPEVNGNRVFGGLGIHGASLFIYSSGPDTRIEAWITDEYGRGGSWTKWFSVDCITTTWNIPLAYTRSGKIVLQKDNERVILFNPENNTCKDYPIYPIGKYGIINYAIYLETLISPNLRSEPSRI